MLSRSAQQRTTGPPRAYILYVLLGVAAGCTAEGAPIEAGKVDAAATSHDRMVKTLELIRERAPSENYFFQEVTYHRDKNALAALPDEGFEFERLQLHVGLAEDCRRLGDTAKSIEHILIGESLAVGGGFLETKEQRAHLYFEIGLCYLRHAETQNCVHCRTGESCILPIGPGGVHKQKEASQKAAEYFKKALADDPNCGPAKWLLNVAAMTLGEYPDGVPEQHRVAPEKFRSKVEFPRFIDVSARAGLKTVACAGGSIAEDFDGDGLFDVFTSNFDPAGSACFFRNKGDGTFEDQTEKAGLAGILGGLNCMQTDYDNDGKLDVFITRGAWLNERGIQPNSLLRNLGGGRFTDVTFEVGLADDRASVLSAAWADYDGDGDLDLYVGHESAPSKLFRNESGKKFTDVTDEAGVANERVSKGVCWGDYDGDRRPDLYVSNLQGANRLYHNDGNGRFTDVAEQLGVTGRSTNFATWFWDVNNDGALDIFSGSYNQGVQYVVDEFFDRPRVDERDSLYLGDASGKFREVSQEFGLTSASQPMGANFGDLDNDGFLDFYLGTGYPGFEGLMPNLMFHTREGKRFDDVTYAGGFGHLQKGHGASFADFDNDGDQDVFIRMGGAFPADAYGSVLFDNPGFGNGFVRIKLTGVRSNRAAIGATIKAVFKDGEERRTAYRWVNSGGSFGANPLEQQIGVGKATELESLEIGWPTTGETQRFEHLPIGGRIEISEGDVKYRRVPLKPAAARMQET